MQGSASKQELQALSDKYTKLKNQLQSMAKKSDKEEKYRWKGLEDKIRELVADQGKLENKAEEFEAFMAA